MLSRSAQNIFLFGGSAFYIFPGPPGHWLPNANCEVTRERCTTEDPECCGPMEAICALTPDDSITGTPTLEIPEEILDEYDLTAETCGTENGVFSCGPATCDCKEALFMQPCDWQSKPELIGQKVYTVPVGFGAESGVSIP